jgi:purine-binding chemotaxis protein CheW
LNVRESNDTSGPLGDARASLVLGLGSRVCAVPVTFVRETMRPLPVEAVEGTPPFVLGLAVIRGQATPVVHLGRLLGEQNPATPSRFVTLRLGDRTLALAVGAVLGVRRLDASALQPLPAILGVAGEAGIESVGELDGELLVVLRATGLLPEPLWQRILGDAASL